MRTETAAWVIAFAIGASSAEAGLVQTENRLDVSRSLESYEPAGLSLLSLVTNGDEPLDHSQSDFTRTSLRQQPASIPAQLPGVVINFEPDNPGVQVGQSLYATDASIFKTPGALPLPSLGASNAATRIEKPISVPLPAMVWPGIATLSVLAVGSVWRLRARN